MWRATATHEMNIGSGQESAASSEKQLKSLKQKSRLALKKLHAMFSKYKFLWSCISFSGCLSTEMTGQLMRTSSKLWISMSVCVCVCARFGSTYTMSVCASEAVGSLEAGGREEELNNLYVLCYSGLVYQGEQNNNNNKPTKKENKTKTKRTLARKSSFSAFSQ